jgi:diguanylate cyclase (GGDEF)-like protein
MVLTPLNWVPLADRFYSIAFLTVPLAVIPILWRAWALRSSYLWLFAIAWAAPIGMAVVRALHNIGLVGWSFWLDNSTILAMALEALLSSLAIAYRIRLLSEERDLAIAQELSTRLLADTDSLTGLLNRRAFLQQVTATPGDKLLVLADIDHFKHVNDTIGHDGGDEVLRIVARALRAAVPAEAMVARIGGEEFAVVADRTTGLEPHAILAALRSSPMPHGLRVTASLGVCHGRLASEDDWKTLYRCADRALFVAKAEGRDRARHAETLAAAA